MDKKRIILLLTAVALLLVCAACASASSTSALSPAPGESEKPVPTMHTYVEGAELFALVGTEEEAKELAELYEIELLSFSDGVAAFHTEEDPSAVVARGRENGWPPVEINYRREPY